MEIYSQVHNFLDSDSFFLIVSLFSLWDLSVWVFGTTEHKLSLQTFFILVLQMGIKMHKLRERCDLLQEDGQVTDPAIDKRMDFHFNAILDVVSEWRKDKSQNQDTPLGGSKNIFLKKCSEMFVLHSMHFMSTEKVQEVEKNFLQESGIQFSDLEEKVLQFHLSNLEYACGSTLDQVWKKTNTGGLWDLSLILEWILGVLMKNIQTGLLLHPAAWITQQQFLNRLCFIFRYLQNPGTTMSFLPSSQETTHYSLRVTLCYYTNWARVLTSAQNARFVVCFVYLLLSPLFSSFHICTQDGLKRIRIWVSPCLFTYAAHIRRASTSDVFTIVCDTHTWWQTLLTVT